MIFSQNSINFGSQTTLSTWWTTSTLPSRHTASWSISTQSTTNSTRASGPHSMESSQHSSPYFSQHLPMSHLRGSPSNVLAWTISTRTSSSTLIQMPMIGCPRLQSSYFWWYSCVRYRSIFILSKSAHSTLWKSWEHIRSQNKLTDSLRTKVLKGGQSKIL